MKKSFTGVLSGGRLKLAEPIGLADGTRVVVTIAPIEQANLSFLEAFGDLKELNRTNPISSGGLKCIRDELYERD